MKQYIVDAFSDRVFHGNPAAICVLDQWLPQEQMMDITRENNLSETAFAVKKQDRYHLRWFTPAGEIDLCGHATLAAAGFEPVQQPAFHGGAGFPVFRMFCAPAEPTYISPAQVPGNPKRGRGEEWSGRRALAVEAAASAKPTPKHKADSPALPAANPVFWRKPVNFPLFFP